MDRPKGPDGLYCHRWLKPMVKVCHTCPLWMPVSVKSGNVIREEWRCADLVTAQAGLVVAERLEARMDELVKEMNALRNETKTSHDHNIAMGAIAVQRANQAIREAINGWPAEPIQDAITGREIKAITG
jgi:hypothetical protein